MKLYDGMTLSQMARQQGPASLQLLVRARDDEQVPWAQRIRAAEMILDRGYGKAVSVIETHSVPIQTLSRDELRRIAAGEAPRLPITIEGEVVESSFSALGSADSSVADVT